jgi:hypothetical protein
MIHAQIFLCPYTFYIKADIFFVYSSQHRKRYTLMKAVAISWKPPLTRDLSYSLSLPFSSSHYTGFSVRHILYRVLESGSLRTSCISIVPSHTYTTHDLTQSLAYLDQRTTDPVSPRQSKSARLGLSLS